ncbi:unnamed protein product [Adineta ricciae]|uniref:TLDc domain-containing protein n=1 Tax=Adineta ricciae TaxID=249248 RepID=A0A814LWH8_ADIRI|nr:unnamed protein product [Adineta ricciae]
MKTFDFETVLTNQRLFDGKEEQKWTLLYKATRDGFSHTDLHRCGDSQGPMPTITQTAVNDPLFGAYTSAFWASTKTYIPNSNSSFLFTSINPYGMRRTEYHVSLRLHAIYGHKNSAASCVDTIDRRALIINGQTNFRTGEIEVYCLAST